MVVGKDAAGGEPNKGHQLADMEDGTSNTIIVVEVCGSGIQWTEPQDVALEEASAPVNSAGRTAIRSHHRGGAHVLFCNGRTGFLSESIDPEVLKKLLTRAGEEEPP